MGQEYIEQGERDERWFENIIFAVDPERYEMLFAPSVDESKTDWMIPQSEADLEDMFQEMREAGINIKT